MGPNQHTDTRDESPKSENAGAGSGKGGTGAGSGVGSGLGGSGSGSGTGLGRTSGPPAVDTGSDDMSAPRPTVSLFAMAARRFA
jgi:hypothetical protein